MWQIKKFKSYEAQVSWIAANSARYQITVLFINNGFAVEYKKLRVIG